MHLPHREQTRGVEARCLRQTAQRISAKRVETPATTGRKSGKLTRKKQRLVRHGEPIY